MLVVRGELVPQVLRKLGQPERRRQQASHKEDNEERW